MSTPTMAHAAKWAFEASTSSPSTSTFDVSSTRFAVVSDNVKATRTPVSGAAIIGYRGRVADRARILKVEVGGTLVFEMSATILEFFIQYMTGDGSSPYVPAATNGSQFDFLRDDGATVYLYQNCQVTAWRIKGSSGGFVTLELDIIALNEIVTGETDAQAYPDIDLPNDDIADHPLIASDCTISLVGTDRDVDDFELSCDLGIEAKFRHSTTYTDLLPGRRTIMFKTNTVWSSVEEDAFYRTDGAGVAGVLTLAYVAGATSVGAVFTMTKVVMPDNAPSVSGDGELIYGIEGEVKGNLPVDTATELSITVDTTV